MVLGASWPILERHLDWWVRSPGGWGVEGRTRRGDFIFTGALTLINKMNRSSLGKSADIPKKVWCVCDMQNLAVQNLVAKHGGEGETPLLMARQSTMNPQAVNGVNYVQLEMLRQTASSEVFKINAPRDNTQLDRHGYGSRAVWALKCTRGRAAQRELDILRQLGAA